MAVRVGLCAHPDHQWSRSIPEASLAHWWPGPLSLGLSAIQLRGRAIDRRDKVHRGEFLLRYVRQRTSNIAKLPELVRRPGLSRN